MTDPMIEEIYTMVYEAFEHGQQSIWVNIFPFKLTSQNIEKYSNTPYVSFWKHLKPGYDIFEHDHITLVIVVENKTYKFAEAK
jgi:murein L,D-transpeptidase YafK